MKQIVKHLLIVCFFLLNSAGIKAQEFLCNIQVNTQQVQGTDKKVYETMQTALTEFLNSRRWTNYEFKINERIECNMLINITDRPSVDRFKATLNIVASRPVFNSAYNSALINYIDKDFEFDYVEFEPLDFQESQYTSNLTSVMAYYLYMVLGLDFDSFSEFGGTPYYQKAEAIVNVAQNSGEKGWNSYENQRNRYWLVENYLNKNYVGLRTFLYNYHRKGLDVMADKPDEGRGVILQSLNDLKKVSDEQPGLFALQLMLNAKSDEIVNIFSQCNPKEKEDAQTVMKQIDPANSSKYSKMGQRN